MSDSTNHGPHDDGTRGPFLRSSKRKSSVALKLTLLVGLALALLLTVLLAGSWFYWRRVIQDQADAHLSAVAASRRDMVKAQIALLLQRVELNTDRGEMRGFLFELETNRQRSANREGSQLSLERMSNGAPIVAAALADKKGNVLLSTDPAEVGGDVFSYPEFSPGLARPHLGVPHWAHGRFEALLAAPIRTRSEPNRVYGVLLATVDVSQLADALRDVTGLGKTGEALLGVREGNHIRFIFPPRNSPQTTTVPLGSAPALMFATGDREVFLRDFDYRGIRALAVGRPIGYDGWGLVLKMDEAEAYAPISRALRLGGFFGIAIAALSLVAASLVAHSFTRPLRRLAEGAARVAGGDYSAPVPLHSADEFGALATAFNEMTAAIEARSAERDRVAEKLREADRRKDEFLAMLGHELRNPLSAIANAARLWKEAPEDPQTANLARTVIERQTGNLGRHVEDLLDVARISAGKIELRRRPVDVGETIHRAAETVRPLIDEKRQALTLSLVANGAGHVDADPTRIEQIITNLLTNAAKYTPEGGSISVVEMREDADVVVTVADSGIGLAPEFLPEIFELFTQGDHSLERSAGGLGIGLNLCRQLIELHGGSISAHSAGLGCGSEFTVRLPALRAPVQESPAAVPAPIAPNGAAWRVLIVDDNKDTLRLLSRLLVRRGHEVSTAADGLAAVQIAQDFHPEVLLLDIGLPGLDGYSLARHLRANGFADALMIAISGYAQESDRRLAEEAGFDHHFAKPVDFDALSALLVAAKP